eukprot:1587862-Pyramimonas_sp.AAC.2
MLRLRLRLARNRTTINLNFLISRLGRFSVGLLKLVPEGRQTPAKPLTRLAHGLLDGCLLKG